ncbi:hypothetical protein [Actinomadura alba]|uniref:Uncharacterized protein n=1 Tax=Actinomadura alba TaxID=406431 RepID=A0ABR7LPH2_9ACTN|nr:hypothetical protein [Actinomadura alba]MBC6466635.1 hypothetical protein [Actinomadura alba]
MITAPTSLNGSPVSLTKPPDDQANRDTAATRHLCAGVYLDRAFRSMVLRRVYSDPYHRVAPSYGFDLVPVVGHAWRSWLLDASQQGVVFLVLVGGCLVSRSVLVTVLCWLGLFFVARGVLGAVPDALRLKERELADRLLKRKWRELQSIKEEDHLRRQLWVVRIGSAVCLVLLMTSVVSASWAGMSPSEGMSAALVLLSPIVFAAVGAAVLRQMSLNDVGHAPVLRRRPLSQREDVIDQQQSHTVAVYHRPEPKEAEERWVDFDPFEREPTIFVGSGHLVHRWLPPLVVQLLSPGEEDMREREYDEPPFRTHELVDHLRSAMRRVSAPEDPRRLALRVRDRVFIDERDVPVERDLLASRPGAAWLRQIIDDPHHAAHHFLEMQISTTGELVTTVFLRATVRGRSLSLDFAACALTRTPFEYHVTDLFGESGPGAIVRAALRALWRLPEETAQVVRLCGLLPTLGRAFIAGRAGRDRTLAPRRRVLIGSRISVREDKSLSWKDSRFDETRVHDDIKLVEQRLLKATEDFLDGCRVDTSVFKEKATNIINNSGVLNMGGRLEMSHTAVGPGSQVQIAVQPQAGATQ